MPDLQREKLVGAGLAHHFSLVLISGEVGIGKPDPRLFRMALCAFGVAPEEAAMVGDNPQKDVRGPAWRGCGPYGWTGACGRRTRRPPPTSGWGT